MLLVKSADGKRAGKSRETLLLLFSCSSTVYTHSRLNLLIYSEEELSGSKHPLFLQVFD